MFKALTSTFNGLTSRTATVADITGKSLNNWMEYIEAKGNTWKLQAQKETDMKVENHLISVEEELIESKHRLEKLKAKYGIK